MEELLKQLITELNGFRNEVTERFNSMEKRFDGLEKGQEEIKETLLRHSATLMSENVKSCE